MDEITLPESAFWEPDRKVGLRKWMLLSIKDELKRRCTPTLRPGAVLVVHVVPESPGMPEEEMIPFLTDARQLPPLPGGHSSTRVNESGAEFVAGPENNLSSRVRLHWEGAIEAYWALQPQESADPEEGEPQYHFHQAWMHWQADRAGTENSALAAIYEYITSLETCGLRWPFYFTLSLWGVRGLSLWTDRQPITGAVGRNEIVFPVIEVSDEPELERALKLLQVKFWNAFGTLHPRQRQM